MDLAIDNYRLEFVPEIYELCKEEIVRYTGNDLSKLIIRACLNYSNCFCENVFPSKMSTELQGYLHYFKESEDYCMCCNSNDCTAKKNIKKIYENTISASDSLIERNKKAENVFKKYASPEKDWFKCFEVQTCKSFGYIKFNELTDKDVLELIKARKNFVFTDDYDFDYTKS